MSITIYLSMIISKILCGLGGCANPINDATKVLDSNHPYGIGPKP